MSGNAGPKLHAHQKERLKPRGNRYGSSPDRPSTDYRVFSTPSLSYSEMPDVNYTCSEAEESDADFSESYTRKQFRYGSTAGLALSASALESMYSPGPEIYRDLEEEESMKITGDRQTTILPDQNGDTKSADYVPRLFENIRKSWQNSSFDFGALPFRTLKSEVLEQSSSLDGVKICLSAEDSTPMKIQLNPPKSKLAQELVRNIWDWINHHYGRALAYERTHTGNENTPADASATTSNVSSSSSSGGAHLQSHGIVKRKNKPGRNDGDGQPPKRPKGYISLPEDPPDNPKYSCPYRKYNRIRYNIHTHRTCALTSYATIARVKAEDICEYINADADDGFSLDVEKRLRSRKKTSRRQTDFESWQSIYRILFKNEIEIPSPYFESPRDEPPAPIISVEEYIRQEVPRRFRECIESSIVNNIPGGLSRLISEIPEKVEREIEVCTAEHRKMVLEVKGRNNRTHALHQLPRSQQTRRHRDLNKEPLVAKPIGETSEALTASSPRSRHSLSVHSSEEASDSPEDAIEDTQSGPIDYTPNYLNECVSFVINEEDEYRDQSVSESILNVWGFTSEDVLPSFTGWSQAVPDPENTPRDKGKSKAAPEETVDMDYSLQRWVESYIKT